MAKTAKSHHASAKSRKPKAVVGKSAKKASVAAKGDKETKKKVTASAKTAAPKAAAKPATEVAKATAAPVPEKKKTDKAGAPGNGMFGRPAMRRGRRPKALAEYQPSNQEEEEYNPDLDYRGLEYDTGIRVNKAKDDGPFSLDRFDDYDEELNFDY